MVSGRMRASPVTMPGEYRRVARAPHTWVSRTLLVNAPVTMSTPSLPVPSVPAVAATTIAINKTIPLTFR